MYEEEISGKRQEHDIESLLARLEEIATTARNVPFSDSCMVDREEILLLLSMIREDLPPELKKAKWLLQQNKQLIAEARKEAENIMRETESRMARMVDEHEITQQAREQADQIVAKAQQQSQQIRSGAMDYAKNMLETVEKDLVKMLSIIQRNKKTL